jgi:hypothetical protein
MKFIILLLISFNAFAIIGTGANQVPSNQMLGEACYLNKTQLLTVENNGKVYAGTTDGSLSSWITGDRGQAAYLNIKDSFSGATDDGYHISIHKDARSNNDATTAPQNGIQLLWEEEAQNLGRGEGVSIDFSAMLIGDSPSTSYPVARIASYKEVTNDFDGAGRRSSLAFYTSTDGEAEPNIKMIVHSDGVINTFQPDYDVISSASTLTSAQIRKRIIQYTGPAANLTMPTGSNMADTANAIDNMSFEFSIVNTGTGAATLVTATGLTLVGNMVVTNGTSGMFRVARTGANLFRVIRLN